MFFYYNVQRQHEVHINFRCSEGWIVLAVTIVLDFKNPSIYNIMRLVAWTIGQNSFKILCKNPFNLFSFFYEITKIKIKSFECPKSVKNIWTNTTWNIRLLVDDLFVPSSKQPSVIYCRLTDFYSHFMKCPFMKECNYTPSDLQPQYSNRVFGNVYLLVLDITER